MAKTGLPTELNRVPSSISILLNAAQICKAGGMSRAALQHRVQQQKFTYFERRRGRSNQGTYILSKEGLDLCAELKLDSEVLKKAIDGKQLVVWLTSTKATLPSDAEEPRANREPSREPSIEVCNDL